MNERQLITACSQRKRKAQQAFFDRYYPSVFRLARRYMSDFHATEDVVIVVFNKALKNISNFHYRGAGSLQKWLNTITINESIRSLKKVHQIHYQEDIETEKVPAMPTYDLDVERVYQILETMPKGYRTVFNLYAIDGYTHSEIAELLNISRNTSKSQLLRARKFIIKALKNEKYGTGKSGRLV